MHMEEYACIVQVHMGAVYKPGTFPYIKVHFIFNAVDI